MCTCMDPKGNFSIYIIGKLLHMEVATYVCMKAYVELSSRNSYIHPHLDYYNPPAHGQCWQFADFKLINCPSYLVVFINLCHHIPVIHFIHHSFRRSIQIYQCARNNHTFLSKSSSSKVHLPIPYNIKPVTKWHICHTPLIVMQACRHNKKHIQAVDCGYTLWYLCVSVVPVPICGCLVYQVCFQLLISY